MIAGKHRHGNGVQITGGLSNENRVQGNFIGTSGTGTAFGTRAAACSSVWAPPTT